MGEKGMEYLPNEVVATARGTGMNRYEGCGMGRCDLILLLTRFIVISDEIGGKIYDIPLEKIDFIEFFKQKRKPEKSLNEIINDGLDEVDFRKRKPYMETVKDCLEIQYFDDNEGRTSLFFSTGSFGKLIRRFRKLKKEMDRVR